MGIEDIKFRFNPFDSEEVEAASLMRLGEESAGSTWGSGGGQKAWFEPAPFLSDLHFGPLQESGSGEQHVVAFESIGS